MLALGKSKPKFSKGRSVAILPVPTPNLPSNVTDRAPASVYCQPNETKPLYNLYNLTTLHEHLIIQNVQLKSEPS